MKTYINAQKPKTILEVIHHSLVAAGIFAPSKSFIKSYRIMGIRILTRIVPIRMQMQKQLATRNNVSMVAKRKKARSTKVRISSHQWKWRSTIRKTFVFDVESKGIATTIAQRRHKGHHKRQTFYPLIMMSQCKVQLNYCIHGGECGIKALSCS